MQPFVCPQCGHRSSFDPWAGAANCPRCGFTPPAGGTGGNYVRWARRQAYQPFLDELVTHWNGTFRPDLAFILPTSDDALAFFRQYQQVLFQVVGTAYQLVLLPVWLAHLARAGRQSLGLVNGQSGKAAFEAAFFDG